ncbi:MAG TPA: hypothetical protein VG496_15935 [Myxococcales bacterium]|nr:hypothetical protein [Myxococcales bacterium]
MLRFAIALHSLALAAWFGGGIATTLATSAVFARAESRKVAGNMAGAILRRTNALRAIAAICFASAILAGARGPSTWFGGACFVLQLIAIPIDLATRKIRRDAGGAMEALDIGDPRRRRFGALHGIAMLLLLLQVLTSAAGLSAQ